MSGVERMYQRARGFYTEDEIDSTREYTIAVAGAGGDGHRYADVVRVFPVANIKVADCEVLEQENDNRVAYSNRYSHGRPKVDVFEETVKSIRPDTCVKKYPDGITLDNVDDFVQGTDLIIEEIELRDPTVAVALYRAARKFGKTVLTTMNIGFAGVATSSHPEGVMYDDLLGIPREMPLDEVKDVEIPFWRLVPYLPYEYVDLQTLQRVIEGASLPSIIQGVDMAAGIGMTEMSLHLLSGQNNRIEPTWAPKWRYMDAYTNESGVVENSEEEFLRRLTKIIERNELGINPKASY